MHQLTDPRRLFINCYFHFSILNFLIHLNWKCYFSLLFKLFSLFPSLSWVWFMKLSPFCLSGFSCELQGCLMKSASFVLPVSFSVPLLLPSYAQGSHGLIVWNFHPLQSEDLASEPILTKVWWSWTASHERDLLQTKRIQIVDHPTIPGR